MHGAVVAVGEVRLDRLIVVVDANEVAVLVVQLNELSDAAFSEFLCDACEVLEFCMSAGFNFHNTKVGNLASFELFVLLGRFNVDAGKYEYDGSIVGKMFWL